MSDLSISAARAYLEAASAAAKPSGGVEPSGLEKGFGEMLNASLSSIQQAGTTAETSITNAAMGQADLVDVVTAVAAAEATLQTVVSVRDEVIRAYQDIMRMPI